MFFISDEIEYKNSSTVYLLGHYKEKHKEELVKIRSNNNNKQIKID